MAVRYFETRDGIKGFVQQEGIFDTKWVVYRKKSWFGDEKIGEVAAKEDDLRKFLEEKFGKPVKIWWVVRRELCFLSSFFDLKLC